MTGKAFFTPFVEASTVRDPAVDIATGSDLGDVEPYLQGIEVRTPRQRYAGTLPKLGSGDEFHEIDITVFGQPWEYDDVVPFEEIDRFNPVLFIEHSGSLNFPSILGNASLNDPERFGGFIEPLGVGSRDAMLVSADYNANGVRAQLQDGNVDSFQKVDRIVHTFIVAEPKKFDDLYIDAADTMGAVSGSIPIVGLFPESERLLGPFDENAIIGSNLASGSLKGGSMLAAVVAMTGSDTGTYIVTGSKSLGMGFTYDGSQFGTDSIAFGGLKR